MDPTPQLGSRALLRRFTVLFAFITAAAAGLYCWGVSAMLQSGWGWLSYVATLLIPIGLGTGTGLLVGGPVTRRFQQIRNAFQIIIDGDLSVRLPERENGIFSASYKEFNCMAEELQEVRNRRDEYMNTFTHEFKTPLTAIRGFAELLQEPGFTEEEQKKYLQVIATEACQLAELANDALLLTKLETKNFPVAQATFWLDEQVSQCIMLLEGSMQEKGQHLSTDIEPLEFCGSKELLSHVWINLIGNAIKYTPQGGEISVSLKKVGDDAVFTVSDNGIGMSDEVMQHIFDRYYQADPGHTHKGIGLGLPIVHGIVSLCRGRIEVSSIPGQGSTFRIVLPLRPANQSAS